jgi:hypothetical protein
VRSNPLRQTRNFLHAFNLFRPFKPSPKNYLSSIFPKFMFLSLPSRLDERGERVVTNVGRGGDGRALAAGRAAQPRTAKSCGPDLPTLGSSLRATKSAGDGGYQARHSRESTKQPLKPSRRECRLYRPCLWFLPPAYFVAGGPWVRPASGIPCALSFPRGTR